MTAPDQPCRGAIKIFAALGIAFGDIGTSPLYSFSTALTAAGGTPASGIGIASLVIWTLFLVVSVKYVMVVMRADYQGEGGILALLAMLLKRTNGRRALPRIAGAGLLVFGAALLFGDGAITPAISVLSAVEGLEAVHPALAPAVLPVAVAILAGLFLVQRFGTGRLAALFAPVMFVWFLVLGLTGLGQVLLHPGVLAAFNPMEGVRLLVERGPGAMAVIGAVVLAVTGAEALYADMGHFGRHPIARAWYTIVFPALTLNYLGQAALVLRVPELAEQSNLFFHLVPVGGLREGMVVLATMATVIASQALISGVFSLSSQAMDLNYFPRFEVRHTSSTQRGQIYLPSVNAVLGTVCVLLVLTFRNSSALAGAYGIAVTGAMIITSIAFGMVVFRVRGRSRLQAACVLFGLLCIDAPLFLSCLTKLFDGGMVPVSLAVGVTALMLTWKRGRELVRNSMGFGAVSVEELARRFAAGEFHRVPGMAVFIYRNDGPAGAIASLMEQYRRVGAVRERVVFVHLETVWDHARRPVHAISSHRFDGGVWCVNARHGYQVEPDVPAMLRRLAEENPEAPPFDPDTTFYVFARAVIMEAPAKRFRRWQRALFALLVRNIAPRPRYLGIPPERLISFSWYLKI